MAPKGAQRALKRQVQGVQPQAKRPKKNPSLAGAKQPEEISLDIVLISGRTIGRLTVEPSMRVHQLREKAVELAEKAGTSRRGMIAQLLHEAKVLEDELTVAESITNRFVLTLTFEAPPLKLRTLSRTSTVSQATAEVTKLKAKLEVNDSSLVVVTAEVAERKSKVAKQKKLLQAAEKELAVASGRMNHIQQANLSIEGELARAMRDARTDGDRIVEKLSIAEALGNLSIAEAMMLDVCDLHTAGDVDDEEFAKVADMIARSANLPLQKGALKAIISVHDSVAGTQPCKSHMYAIGKLSAQIIAVCRNGQISHCAEWLALSKAICLNGQATPAVLLVEGVVAHAKTWRSVCPVRDLMYPILKLLRSANLPAASQLETSLCAELEEGRENIAWMDLAKTICDHKDCAIAPSFVRGVIARTTLMGSAKQHRASSCPLVGFMAPVFVQLRSLDFPELSDLQSALILELEAAIVKYVPTAQDFAMPAEAAQIGDRNRKLRDFLSSPVQRTVEFNETKAGRMAIHRLIDGTIGHGKLTHGSTGGGHSRTLVVRKAALEQTYQHNEQKTKLESQRRQLLNAMKEYDAGKGAPEMILKLEKLLASFSLPSNVVQVSNASRTSLGYFSAKILWS